MTVCDVECVVKNWVSKIVDHVSDPERNCKEIAWADSIGGPFGIQCLTCSTRFTISHATLHLDDSVRAKILYEGLRTMNGKDVLMRTIHSWIEKQRGERPKTAWTRVLDDLV